MILISMKKLEGMVSMSKVIEAVKEASISVACLLDDLDSAIGIGTYENYRWQKDIEHIQNQITIIENFFEEVSDEL